VSEKSGREANKEKGEAEASPIQKLIRQGGAQPEGLWKLTWASGAESRPSPESSSR
jgi:hypothetical protein